MRTAQHNMTDGTVCFVSLTCLRSLVSVFEMFELVCFVFLRWLFEMSAHSGNWRPIPIIAKTRSAEDVGKRKTTHNVEFDAYLV